MRVRFSAKTISGCDDSRPRIESRNRIRMRRQPRADSLPKGVTVTPKGRYLARFCRDAKIIHVGVYDTVEEAVDARSAALLSHATMPMTAAPVMEQEQPVEELPSVVPVVPQAAPPPDSTDSWPTPAPGHCPRCNSPLWGPCSGDGMICKQCGLQTAVYNPPNVSRSDYASGAWRRRAE